MRKMEADRPLSEGERKEVFLALVQVQDAGTNVAQSRKEVAQRFGISDRQVKRIEQEGVDGEWPPL
jgi:DNA invertase Pin-like site-specific DNA recombinase